MMPGTTGSSSSSTACSRCDRLRRSSERGLDREPGAREAREVAAGPGDALDATTLRAEGAVDLERIARLPRQEERGEVVPHQRVLRVVAELDVRAAPAGPVRAHDRAAADVGVRHERADL